MGLDDRAALQVLRAAFTVPDGAESFVGRLFTRWFGTNPAARDLFPVDLSGTRTAFAQAMSWVYGEFIAQRAQEPVSFLAQLGRDHRKYGVTQHYYDTMGQVLYAALRDELADGWTAAVDDAARESLNLIIGVMGGAADADEGPAWWDGTVVEFLRVSRDLAVVRLQLDRPLPYYPGQYVKVEVPQCPRSWRYLSPSMPAEETGAIEFHVRAVSGGLVSTAIVGETSPGDRWRLSSPHGGLHVDRDAGDVLMVAGSTGLAPLRAIIMDLTRWAVNPRVHLFWIGINVNQTKVDFDEELRGIASSLRIETGHPVDRTTMVRSFCESLDGWYERFLCDGLSPILEYARRRCLTLGRPVTACSGDQEVSGMAVELDGDGRLVIRDAKGALHRLLAGDVTLTG